MKEMWKPVSGYETRYKVSNTGVVKRIAHTKVDCIGRSYNMPEKIMTPHARDGYMLVDLTDLSGKTHSLSVHRIVADAFITNIDNKPEVNHIDGDRSNNHVDNLEWCTRQENMDNAVERGATVHSEARKEQLQKQWADYWSDPKNRKAQSERRKKFYASKGR